MMNQTSKKASKLFKNAQDILHRNYCKNAVTGADYPLIGSTSEAHDNLFVYRNVTGILDLANPFNLYYDSPEQCENHLGIKINNDVKTRWREKMELIVNKQANDNSSDNEDGFITVK